MFLIFFILIASSFLKENKLEIAYGMRCVQNEFPHMVALVISKPAGAHLCGGALINNRTILTAAHCLMDTSYNKYPASNIVAGIGNVDIKAAKGYSISNVIVHSGFNFTTLFNDIGILILSQEVEETDEIRYMDLVHHTKSVGDKLWVTGFGLYTNEYTSQYLQKIYVPIAADSSCNVHPLDISKTCIGDGKKDSCGGDSGGVTAYVDNLNAKRFIGDSIVSYGPDVSCLTLGKYGVYTNIEYYFSWVWNNAQGGPPATNNSLSTLQYIDDKLTDQRTCFGVQSDSSNVCSGRGECYGSNLCDCSIGWQGTNCEQIATEIVINIAIIVLGVCAFLACIFASFILAVICVYYNYKNRDNLTDVGELN